MFTRDFGSEVSKLLGHLYSNHFPSSSSSGEQTIDNICRRGFFNKSRNSTAPKIATLWSPPFSSPCIRDVRARVWEAQKYKSTQGERMMVVFLGRRVVPRCGLPSRLVRCIHCLSRLRIGITQQCAGTHGYACLTRFALHGLFPAKGTFNWWSWYQRARMKYEFSAGIMPRTFKCRMFGDGTGKPERQPSEIYNYLARKEKINEDADQRRCSAG